MDRDTGIRGFNTQPPEGGWVSEACYKCHRGRGFNTQPPEGGWKLGNIFQWTLGSFNTQPPEGGWQK